MDRNLPNEETITAAVGLACRAPSVHNSQPWSWRLGDQSLHLYTDRSRRLTAIDPTGADMVLSCGAALHHLRVGLAALGWHAVVHRLPDPDDPDHLASIEFAKQEPADSDIALASAIPRRRTDRRRFSSWEVPTALLAQLADRAAHEGVLAAEVRDSKARYALFTAVSTAATTQEADLAYRTELSAWSGVDTGSTEGVPAANIPAHGPPYATPYTRAFPGGELAQPYGSEWEEDGASLLVLGTSSDDALSRLRAGEATSAVLLEATSAGLASCPLSQPLEVPTTRDVLRDEVLDSTMIPQIVLRIGWAALNADPLPPTPRRPPHEVLTRLGKQ